MNFNDESKKPRFISKPNPLVSHSYQIFEYKQQKGEYEPVGEYTVIDLKEDSELTAKKLVNLIALMNGRKPLINFENLTQERILYTMVTDNSAEETHEKIIFRTYHGSGVSKENAVLTIEKGVFHEKSS